MKTLYLTVGITALLLLGSQPAASQSSYVEGVSAIINAGTNSTQIETYSETFETADIAYYYEAYVEGYLYQNGALIADGAALGSPYTNDAYGYMTQPLHVPDTYEIQSDHYLVAYYTSYDAATGTYEYDNPDYFTNDGGYGGSNDFLPGSSGCGCYYETVAYIFLGTTAVQMSSAPPTISSISPTGVSLGTSGTLTVNGSDLVDVFTQTATAAISGSGITWSIASQSATQVTINYSVTTSAGTGSRTLTLSDRFGSSSATFNVGDATPQVTSISPGTWNAGTTASVTFGGNNFGTAPTLSFSSSDVTASITRASNTQIVANVSVAATAPNESVTVTVTSHGYNGSGFISSNGNSASGTDTATVVPIAAPDPDILNSSGAKITGQTGLPNNTGEQVLLKSGIVLPSGLSVSSYNWSVGGTNIGGYTPTPSSNATGDIKATTLTDANVTFYWVYPGQGLVVSFKYCMNNGQCSNTVQVTFNVKGVTNGLLNATTISSAVKFSTVTDNCTGDRFNGQTTKWINLGSMTGISGTYPNCKYSASPGITFTASGTMPASGKWSFVQLILTNSDAVTTTTSSTTSSCGTGLDNFYPYPMPSGSTNSTGDAPGGLISPTPGYTLTEFKRSFTAMMYLMWQSNTANSIPVPIGYHQWFAIEDGLRSSSGSWSLASDTNWSSGTFVAATESQTAKGYPTWSSVVHNGTCTNDTIETTE